MNRTQYVPGQCDRIVWRGSIYMLPWASAPDLIDKLVCAIRHLQDAVSSNHRVVRCYACERVDEIVEEAIVLIEKTTEAQPERLVHQPQGPVIGYTGKGSIHGAAKGRALADDEINP